MNTKMVIRGRLTQNAAATLIDFASSEIVIPVMNKAAGNINKAAWTCAKLKFRLNTR